MNKHLTISLSIFLSLLTLLLVAFLFAFPSTQSAIAESNRAISNKGDFFSALAEKQQTIKISDLDLEGDIVAINYSVTIIGDGATLKNAYLKISAPIKKEECISVTLKGIKFDGGFTTDRYENAESFDDIYGSNRDNERCIDANVGYYDLTIEECEITHYASEVAPCVFIENDYRDSGKSISISNCRFYDNYSKWDTIHLSNDYLMVSIKNSYFYDNKAYKAAGFNVANAKIEIDNVEVYDNVFCPLDVDQNNPQSCGGGVYLGGTEGTVKNLTIRNNETVFGGGLGISPKTSGESELDIDNLKILSCKAKYGGAIAVHSLSGQPVVFSNGEFYGNSAEIGSTIYAINYAYWRNVNNGGIVKFLFCNFASNSATDRDTFSFYKENETKGQLGKIVMKGCFIIAEDEYLSVFSDYNYVDNASGAIEKNVITENLLDNAVSNGISPVKNSIADISIPASVYSTWSPKYVNATEDVKIGKRSDQTTEEYITPNKKGASIWTLVGSLFAVAILITFAVIPIKKKNDENFEQSSTQVEETPQIDPRPERWATLSEREKNVAILTIQCKKRQEIASILQFSENTIKKDLTTIYSKLEVEGKAELIAKYQDVSE